MALPIINDGGIQREMTKVEHEQWLQLVAEIEAHNAATEATLTAKESARTKLKDLGLTDEEIAALVGG